MAKILGVDEAALSDYEREVYQRAAEYRELLISQVRKQASQLAKRLLANSEISFAPVYHAGELPSRDDVARELAIQAVRQLGPEDQRALVEAAQERLQITS
jgi:hypothetical protein